MKFIIDGDEYIKKDFIIDEETKNLIIEVYSVLWTEAYYDATHGSKTRDFSRHLSDKMSIVVKNLGLRD